MFLKHQSNRSKLSRHEGGFSLIEVAIVLAVIGILAGPLIQQYNINRAVEIHKTSVDNLSVVTIALQKYAINNSKYPLPSDKNIAANNAAYGQPSITPIVGCTLTSATICRTTSGSLGSAPVLIGTVPFAAIGIPEQYTFDGYKRKFTYAVTQALTVAPMADNGGVITVKDNTGGNHENTASNVHFVVVSHGANGKGASTIAGKIASPCTNTGSGADEENCNNDAVFTSNFLRFGPVGATNYVRLQFDVAGPTYYDDDIQFATTTTSDIWTLSSNSSNADIYKRTTSGNIRIGTWGTTGLLTNEITPSVPRQPEARIDVAGKTGTPGNVKATELLVNRLCTLTETAGATPNVGCVVAGTAGAPLPKVFEPAVIANSIVDTYYPKTAGYGINCGQYTAMTGIKDVDEVCGYNYIPPATITIDASCTGGTNGPGGQKIQGGKLYCGAN